MNKEEFRDIPGYEGYYQVSNKGTVLSFHGKTKELKQTKSTAGYYYVTLSVNNSPKKMHIHQLVAMAFHGHIPCGFDIVVNHIDHNRLNNRADNLNLLSMRENSTEYKNDLGITNGYKNTYYVNIQINNDSIYLGSYKDKKNALNIYKKALLRINEYNGDKQEFKCLINPKLRGPKNVTILRVRVLRFQKNSICR
jgi:hypothetical protein